MGNSALCVVFMLFEGSIDSEAVRANWGMRSKRGYRYERVAVRFFIFFPLDILGHARYYSTLHLGQRSVDLRPVVKHTPQGVPISPPDHILLCQVSQRICC